VDYESYGMEDPRIMTIEDETYVTYVVLSNYVKNNPSIYTALAKTEDFSHYERLGIITVPGDNSLSGSAMHIPTITTWSGLSF